jgi:protein-arginine kinase activator protein McsA
MEKIYNILIMTEDANVQWLDRKDNFVKDRLLSKIFLEDESKEITNKLRESGEYVMVGRFPADLDWKDRDGKVLYYPTKNKLESLLEIYIENENYEDACVIRDQLKLI